MIWQKSRTTYEMFFYPLFGKVAWVGFRSFRDRAWKGRLEFKHQTAAVLLQKKLSEQETVEEERRNKSGKKKKENLKEESEVKQQSRYLKMGPDPEL